MDVVQTHIIPNREAIDDDVLRGITSLGCFKDKEKLTEKLLETMHNTGEKPERSFFPEKQGVRTNPLSRKRKKQFVYFQNVEKEE